MTFIRIMGSTYKTLNIIIYQISSLTPACTGYGPSARALSGCLQSRGFGTDVARQHGYNAHPLTRRLPACPRAGPMTRIQYFSDIHLEFGAQAMPASNADIIVAAGDIGLGLQGLQWLETAGKPVVYVAGNHEFYCGDLPIICQELQRRGRGGPVHYLENESVIIGDVRFLGATLWTDFDGGNHKLLRAAEQHMNDYHQIHYHSRPMMPAETVALNAVSRQWLAEQLATHHDGPTVVVTHHAPSFGSWKGNQQSFYRHAYCNDLSDMMELYGPAAWIHGHIHHVSDYQVGGTRVLCNPRGYHGFQEIAGFDLLKVVEV